MKMPRQRRPHPLPPIKVVTETRTQQQHDPRSSPYAMLNASPTTNAWYRSEPPPQSSHQVSLSHQDHNSLHGVTLGPLGGQQQLEQASSLSSTTAVDYNTAMSTLSAGAGQGQAPVQVMHLCRRLQDELRRVLAERDSLKDEVARLEFEKDNMFALMQNEEGNGAATVKPLTELIRQQEQEMARLRKENQALSKSFETYIKAIQGCFLPSPRDAMINAALAAKRKADRTFTRGTSNYCGASNSDDTDSTSAKSTVSSTPSPAPPGLGGGGDASDTTRAGGNCGISTASEPGNSSNEQQLYLPPCLVGGGTTSTAGGDEDDDSTNYTTYNGTPSLKSRGRKSTNMTTLSDKIREDNDRFASLVTEAPVEKIVKELVQTPTSCTALEQQSTRGRTSEVSLSTASFRSGGTSGTGTSGARPPPPPPTAKPPAPPTDLSAATRNLPAPPKIQPPGVEALQQNTRFAALASPSRQPQNRVTPSAGSQMPSLEPTFSFGAPPPQLGGSTSNGTSSTNNMSGLAVPNVPYHNLAHCSPRSQGHHSPRGGASYHDHSPVNSNGPVSYWGPPNRRAPESSGKGAPMSVSPVVAAPVVPASATPSSSTASMPGGDQHRAELLRMCERYEVEKRTAEWFAQPEHSRYWEALVHKSVELERRNDDGSMRVKNSSAWLTKFFNVLRTNPDEARPRKGSGMPAIFNAAQHGGNGDHSGIPTSSCGMSSAMYGTTGDEP
ncbi:unnamed protein product [Amoebophrya sp. A25]|nr:unnamed protein product [Amoebophrya sp. A25]|eukprot:GSA25T00016933001.1